ncbi:hypothetical protein [Allobranchiibius sp. GilTou73]|uniref:hypothetical protein n=1 Tax=Allobranchiibius sp. GilTou73 TaxID=2904523 RepID=UPI001F2ADE12|nr:hypothetical protein [Allobranchiibius sp. GilTou73]UIJ34795.1 hypothetical protein LVQ62_17165 [Allobranchiibius sp. GilTou73]
MTPPSIHRIQSDDELLDRIGSRAAARDGVPDDDLTDLLIGWVAHVDDAPAAASDKTPGRYARTRRGGVRAGVAAAVLVGTLSVSGMAAAVTSTTVPVLQQLGQVTRGLVFVPPDAATQHQTPSPGAPIADGTATTFLTAPPAARHAAGSLHELGVGVVAVLDLPPPGSWVDVLPATDVLPGRAHLDTAAHVEAHDDRAHDASEDHGAHHRADVHRDPDHASDVDRFAHRHLGADPHRAADHADEPGREFVDHDGPDEPDAAAVHVDVLLAAGAVLDPRGQRRLTRATGNRPRRSRL